MMFTTLMDGVRVSTRDDLVLQAIQAEPADLKMVRQQRMRIGVRNEDGAIYRVIGVEGIAEFLNLIEQFTELDYVDELEEKSSAWKGYDVIFKAR